MNRTVLFISSIRYRRRAAGTWAELRRIPAYMLVLLVRGSGKLVVDGQASDIQSLQAMLLIPGMRVSFRAKEETEYVIMPLDAVSLGKRDSRWTEAGEPELPSALLQMNGTLYQERAILERLELLRQSAKKGKDDAALQLAFQELLAALVREAERNRPRSNPQDSFEQSVRYLEGRLQHPISIAELAGVAGLTPTSYSRKFKQRMGMSPVDYMNKLRIETAKQQLSEQGSTVKGVAAQVGFNSEFYFSRTFKEATGLSPNLYIRRNKLSIATMACNHYDESLRSLGVEPVIRLNGYRYPGMGEREHAVRLEQHLEALAVAKPDLIVTDRYHEELHARLKRIATVIALPYEEDWRVTYRRIAEVSGQEKQVGRVLGELEAAASKARIRLGRTAGSATLALMRITPKLVRVQPAPMHPLNDLLFAELGLAAGELQPFSSSKLEFAPEQLSSVSIQSDFLFVEEHFWGERNRDILRQVRSSAFWTENEAVQHDRIRYIPNWFAMSWTPPGRKQIIASLLSGVWF